MPLYTNVFSGWLDYPEYFFIWCYHGKNSIFNTMSYQSKAMDGFIDGAVTAAAEGDKAGYDKDVKGFVDPAFADMPRIPLFQPYSTSRCRRTSPATSIGSTGGSTIGRSRRGRDLQSSSCPHGSRASAVSFAGRFEGADGRTRVADRTALWSGHGDPDATARAT